MRFICRKIGLLPLLLLLLSCSDSAELGFIDDRAGLLSDQEKVHLVSFHDSLLKDFDVHFKLITLEEEPADINMLAAELFGTLGLETNGARGMLYMVDPMGEQVRVEVGYDLEALFTDRVIGYLEEKQMKPFFQADRIGQGIEAMSELLIARLKKKAFLSGPDRSTINLDHYSGGAGAKTDMSTASGSSATALDLSVYSPQANPEETLAVYMMALANHEKDPSLAIYTSATQKFFSQWIVTDAQQDNELQHLRSIEPEGVFIAGDRAVIRYPMNMRTYPPYFLQRGDDGWMLDFAAMNRYIQMNHKNMWRLKKLQHDYMFAFADWVFDANGFAFRKR